MREQMKEQRRGAEIMKRQDYYWMAGYIVFFGIAAYCVFNGAFTYFNQNFPYLAGFVQFILFASGGELLSIRILYGYWATDKAMAFKALVWGIGGLILTVLFSVLPKGVAATMDAGLLPFAGNDIAAAIETSVILNLFSMPIHAAAMRIFANYGEERFYRGRRMGAREAVNSVEWGEFVDFTYFKTVPFFWIPVNSIGFLLPEDLRIAFAAFLSFVFGMLMTLLKLREKEKGDMTHGCENVEI